MNQLERRNAIIHALRSERHTTMAKLASEFGVGIRTIRKDITALSLTFPLTTVRDRYGGGVELASWFQPYASTLSPKQEELLQRIKTTLEGDDLIVLNSILAQFSLSHSFQ